MRGVHVDGGVIKPAEVKAVEPADEQRGRHQRMRQEARELAVQRQLDPLAQSGRITLACRGQHPQQQRDGTTQYQEHRHQHREHHVRDHVHAEHGGHVPADTR
ncbi:Uncharacterised protein [Mycobacteroides abscessus subsp. massiliense]|nr:Uncharacterised protein [Mycobacteroides abscessus subsp. massiliense]